MIVRLLFFMLWFFCYCKDYVIYFSCMVLMMLDREILVYVLSFFIKLEDGVFICWGFLGKLYFMWFFVYG